MLRLKLPFILYASLGTLFMPNSVSAISSSFGMLEWNEIRPAAIQAETVVGDSPHGRPVIDQNSEAIWITGTRFIWQWSLRDGAMSRWEQPSDRAEGFLLVYADAHNLIGVDSKSVWLLPRKQKNWRRLDGAFSKACAFDRAYLLPADGSHRKYLVNNCGVFLILLDPGQLVATVGSSFKLMPDTPQLFSGNPEGVEIVTTRGRDLIVLSLDGPRIKERVVYTAKSLLRGVAQSGKMIMAWSSQAIMFFDEKYHRQQVVPVIGTRKIQAVGASANTHVVSFSDGTLELMNLRAQRKWASPRIDQVAQYVDIVSNDSFIVMSSDQGMPRIFSILTQNIVTPQK